MNIPLIVGLAATGGFLFIAIRDHVDRLILRFRDPAAYRALVAQEREDDDERGGMFG